MVLRSQTRDDSSSNHRIGHRFSREAVDYPTSRCPCFQKPPVCHKVPQGRIQPVEIDDEKQLGDAICPRSRCEHTVRVHSNSQGPGRIIDIGVHNCSGQNRQRKVYVLFHILYCAYSCWKQTSSYRTTMYMSGRGWKFGGQMWDWEMCLPRLPGWSKGGAVAYLLKVLNFSLKMWKREVSYQQYGTTRQCSTFNVRRTRLSIAGAERFLLQPIACRTVFLLTSCAVVLNRISSFFGVLSDSSLSLISTCPVTRHLGHCGRFYTFH